MFEWDDVKNQINYDKHGICFEDACQIFASLVFQTQDTRFDYGEERYIALGDLNGLIITVVFTCRDEIVRLISARVASKGERGIYHDFKENLED